MPEIKPVNVEEIIAKIRKAEEDAMNAVAATTAQQLQELQQLIDLAKSGQLDVNLSKLSTKAWVAEFNTRNYSNFPSWARLEVGPFHIHLGDSGGPDLPLGRYRALVFLIRLGDVEDKNGR